MTGKMALCVFIVFGVLFSAWAQAPTTEPKSPKPPKGTVQQTISRTTYVQENALDRSTLIPANRAAIPPGMTLVCHLYAEAEQGAPATNQSAECALPENAKLDSSFRQTSFPTPCSGGGATSPITPADMPQGIYIACDGGYYWAVIPPIRLEALEFDNNGMVIQWGVRVQQLYCGPGGAPNGGCNVKLDVYAKLRP